MELNVLIYGGGVLFFFFFFKEVSLICFVMERTPTYISKWKKKQDVDYIQLKKRKPPADLIFIY